MAKSVILYGRVSTLGQAERGYSLPQQMEALQEYADKHGYRVIDAIPDPGYSGASLERPGLDRVRKLVSAGGVDMVLAQERDRFSREPALHYILKTEFAEHGTTIHALNDSGDDSPEGELTTGMLDQIAKYYRADIARKSMRGKVQKAKQGKIVAGNVPDYGFRFNANRDGYEIDPKTMRVVRRIFRDLANGESLYAIASQLDAEGIKPPGLNNRSGTWGTDYISRCLVPDDVYRPHTYDEIAEQLTPDVAAQLDSKRSYGIKWHNRYETKTKKTRGTDGKYKRRHIRRERPREEWIAVPVPAAGIPLEHIEAARAAIKDNRRYPSKAAGREWELSGGVARCGSCGHGLTARPSKARGKHYYYYYCTNAQGKRATCDNKKSVPAVQLETRVADLVTDILSNEDRVITEIDALIEAECGALHDPKPEAKAWAERIVEIDRKQSRLFDLYSDGDIPKEQLKTKLAELDEQKAEAEAGLKTADSRRERIAELERDKADLQKLYRERALDKGLADFEPKQRREVYRRLRLIVHVHADQSIGVQGDLPLTLSYFDSPFMVTDIDVDSHGYSATFVCQNQEWGSVHSQSNSQDSSRFTGVS